MSVLAIIPARGGSKGIHRKNLVIVAGKPLLAWTIEAALNTREIGRLVVSTEDAEIARYARGLGAQIVDRPQNLANDTASSESALLHALEYLDNEAGYRPELVVFLQCTSILTTPDDISGTIRTLRERNADSAFAAVPFHRHVWRRDSTADTAVGINHDKRVRNRRQEEQEQYLETGSVYVLRAEGFLEARHRFFGKTVYHILTKEKAFEIDEPVDLRVAETLLRESDRYFVQGTLPRPIGGVAFDSDGVSTDNKVQVDQDGKESVRCDRGDGLGLGLLKAAGIPMIVLSKERNPVVAARCGKLGLECRQGLDEKERELQRWSKELEIPLDRIVFMGNDVNDLECLRIAGCAVCPADAHPEVLAQCRIVLSKRGGDGAIRELAEMVLENAGEEWPGVRLPPGGLK